MLGVQGQSSGRALAVLSAPDGRMLWWARGESVLTTAPDITDALGVAFAAEGRWVAVLRASGAIQFFAPYNDPKQGIRAASIPDAPAPATAAVFSPDGASLLTYGFPVPGPIAEVS